MWQDNQVAHLVDLKQRSDDVLISESISFEDFLLSDKVLAGLHKSGFYKPSPIQLKAIPLGRCGLDLIVQAKSGTGKTCVFSVIALDNIDVKSNSLQVVVLAPTREIALQIHGVISCIGQDISHLSVQVFIGGTLVSEDRIKAKKCHVAIGSPGRLKQLIELGVLNTRNVRMFVLDEADKLVEEGSFQKQINWIYSSLPTNKQMLALSATYPEELAQFLTRYMRQPTFVRLDAAHPSLLGLRQYYYVVKPCALPHLLFEEKTKHVINLLSNVAFQQVLIFSNYHSRAESICEALNCNGWSSAFISGNMEQSRRIDAINNLKQFKCRVLVSTDLTSRGIDAHNVNMVINMDIPCEWETYLHRIGRAGRYGSRGIAVSLVSEGEEEKKLLALTAQCNATLLPLNDISKDLGFPSNAGEDNLSKTSEIKTTFEKTTVTLDGTPRPGAILASERESTDCGSSTSGSDRNAMSPRTISSCSEVPVQTPDDDFLNRVIRENSDAPLIVSLLELQSKADCLRKNRHYLTMSYADLKKDYDHFARTGEFLQPSATSDSDRIETQPNNFSSDSGKEKLCCATTEQFLESSRTSDIDRLEMKLNSLSTSNHQEESHVQDITTVVESETKNVSIKSSPCDLPSPDVQTKSKATCARNLTKPTANSQQRTKTKTKTENDKTRMKAARRHPQSAAAGLDFLKHWTEVENSRANTNSAFQTQPNNFSSDSGKEKLCCATTEQFLESSRTSDIDRLEMKLNSLSTSNHQEESHVQDITTVVESETKNVSIKSSPCDLPSPDVQTKSKATCARNLTKPTANSQQRTKTKTKTENDKTRMKAARRHPQSAAAGLDFLKHWTEVENSRANTNSAFQTQPNNFSSDSGKEKLCCATTEQFLESSRTSDIDRLEMKLNNLSTSNHQEESHVQDITTVVESETKNVSIKSSPCDLPSPDVQTKSKATCARNLTKPTANSQQRTKTKTKTENDKTRMKTPRRHPQSAAAGLDFLKHWTEVENSRANTNSAFQTLSPSSSRNSHPIERSRPEHSQTSFKTFCNSSANCNYRSSNNRNSAVSPSSDSDSDYTSTDSEDSSSDTSSEDANECFISPPPVLYPFGSTGHCFNPYLCPHPSLAAAKEAMLSHQVYHHAMNHARKLIFRL